MKWDMLLVCLIFTAKRRVAASMSDLLTQIGCLKIGMAVVTGMGRQGHAIIHGVNFIVMSFERC